MLASSITARATAVAATRFARWLFVTSPLLCAGCEPATPPADAAPASTDTALGGDVPLAVDAPTPARDAGRPAPYEIPDCGAPPTEGFAPLRPRCGLFADAEGRTVLLRGVNARVEGLFDVTFADGRTPLQPIPDFTDDDARRMRALGMNLLRLPINWSGLEPEDASPRAFEESYLARLRAVLDLCRAHGIYVLVDWHQDAYSKEIGEDGAPLWAISPPPATLLEGPLTDLGARRTSPEVLAAFETFFGDEGPGPALRARFGEAVAHVVRALEGDASVVGFEIYNEPVASDDATRRLNEEIAAIIARADPSRLAFFEPPALPRNFTGSAGLAERPFAVPGGVYAPHSYTLAFTGTDDQRMSFTRETLRPMHANAVLEAAAWGTPLVIGEWGYDPNGIRGADYLLENVILMDEYAESWAFWVWKERSQGRWGVHDYDDATGAWTEREVVVRALSRPRPERIAGWPRRFGYDDTTGVLEVVYRGEGAISAPTTIYVPERAPATFVVRCDGAVIEGLGRAPDTGLVEVDCPGAGEHTIRVEGLVSP